MNDRQFFVYILSNKLRGTLYVGHTNNLSRRILEHKSKAIKGFTAKYNLNLLVWYDTFTSAADAQTFERRLKRWARDWKIQLIEKHNPHWQDLTYRFVAE